MFAQIGLVLVLVLLSASTCHARAINYACAIYLLLAMLVLSASSSCELVSNAALDVCTSLDSPTRRFEYYARTSLVTRDVILHDSQSCLEIF